MTQQDSQLLDEMRRFSEAILAGDKLRPEHSLPNEPRFCKINCGIIASTEIDAHGEAFTHESLVEQEPRYNEQIIWTGYNHDPLIPPIGRVIRSRTFSTGGHSYLLGLYGIYELDEVHLVSQTEILDEDPDPGYPTPGLLAHPDSQIVFEVNPRDYATEYVRQAIEPEFQDSLIVPTFSKSVSSLVIVTISIVVGGVAGGIVKALLEGYVKKMGELAAERTVKKLGSATSQVYTKLSPQRTIARPTLRGVRVSFVISEGLRESDIAAAADRLVSAVKRADWTLSRYQKLRYQPDSALYEYDAELPRWILSAVTSRTHGPILTEHGKDRVTAIFLDALAAEAISPAGTGRSVPVDPSNDDNTGYLVDEPAESAQ